jgi:hypothetical protein
MLNQYFVPVTSRNEEAFEQNGIAPPDEKKERMRIYLEFFGKKLGIGDVHVYVLGADKNGIASLPIVPAQDPAQMLPFLQGIVTKLNLKPSPPSIKPHPTSRPPANLPPDTFVVHLVSRALSGGSWHEFPSENWILLNGAESNQLLPPGKVEPKQSWTIPQPVALKLAEWVYPQNEEKTGKNRSRVDVADFRLTAVTVEGRLVRARIDGKIKLWHGFYPGAMNPQNEKDIAASELIGYIDFDVAQRRIQRLRIVTEKGTYPNTAFAASLVSMSKETLAALQ